LGGLAVVFEWGSTLRQMDCGLFNANIRSLCLPASLRTLPNIAWAFSGRFGVLFFESSSQIRRLTGPLPLGSSDFFTMLPASLEFIGEYAFFRYSWDQHASYAIEAGNRHFTVYRGAIMNFARTSVIRYFGGVPIAPLDSMIEELARFSLAGFPIQFFTFSEPSRLRLIGHSAFTYCNRLSSIAIPSAVEVIAKRAFYKCKALREVRIGTGSHLRLIGKHAFDGCRSLQPVDVPWLAAIRCSFKVMATVYDEDGSKRVRVKFNPVIIHE
jgi:hypothetical protein